MRSPRELAGEIVDVDAGSAVDLGRIFPGEQHDVHAGRPGLRAFTPNSLARWAPGFPSGWKGKRSLEGGAWSGTEARPGFESKRAAVASIDARAGAVDRQRHVAAGATGDRTGEAG